MTMVQLLILQFIAHLLSDFVFQPQRWCDKKEGSLFNSYHVYHIIIVFSCTFVLSFDLGFWKVAIFLTLTHFVIDMLKSYAISKFRVRYMFFIDQFLHILFITAIVILYEYTNGIHFLLDLETRTLAIIAGYIFCAKPSNIIIKFMMEAFSIQTPVENPENKDKSLPNAGKLIGITERFLSLTLILLGKYEVVGLIIAAKSILRFNDTQKTEYVLVGTLLSFSIAAFTGLAISFIPYGSQ